MSPINERFVEQTQRLESIKQTEGFSKTTAVIMTFLTAGAFATGISGVVIGSPYTIIGGVVSIFVSVPISITLCKFNYNRSKEKENIQSKISNKQLAIELVEATKEEQKKLISALASCNRLNGVLKWLTKDREKVVNSLSELANEFLGNILGLENDYIDSVLSNIEKDTIEGILHEKFKTFNQKFNATTLDEKNKTFKQADLFYCIAEQFGVSSYTLKTTLFSGPFAENTAESLMDFSPFDKLFEKNTKLYEITNGMDEGKKFLKNWQDLKDFKG